MSESIRIEGIYSKEMAEKLFEKNISAFMFDCRPKSFKFIQQYKILEILTNDSINGGSFFINYEYEKDFMIQHMVSELNSLEIALEKKVFLEFSDRKPLSFYEQFKYPYFWHYDPLVDMREILNGEYLKGIIFNNKLIENNYDLNTSDGVYNKFLKEHYPLISEKNISLGFKMDWDSNVFQSLFDFIEFDFISLPLNEKVEIQHNQVDQENVDKNLIHYKKLII